MGPGGSERRIMRRLIDLARGAPHPMFVTLAIMMTKNHAAAGRHGVQMRAFCRGIWHGVSAISRPGIDTATSSDCDSQNPGCRPEAGRYTLIQHVSHGCREIRCLAPRQRNLAAVGDAAASRDPQPRGRKTICRRRSQPPSERAGKLER